VSGCARMPERSAFIRCRRLEGFGLIACLLACACVPLPRGDSPDDVAVAGAPATAGRGASGSNAAGSSTAGAGCDQVASASPTSYPDSGPCDDSAPLRVSAGANTLGHYAVTCESQAPGRPGCKGLPSDTWGRCVLRRCPSTETYPLGCIVHLPHENPFYPGGPQTCECSDAFDAEPSWLCPL